MTNLNKTLNYHPKIILINTLITYVNKYGVLGNIYSSKLNPPNKFISTEYLSLSKELIGKFVHHNRTDIFGRTEKCIFQIVRLGLDSKDGVYLGKPNGDYVTDLSKVYLWDLNE